MQIMQRPLCGLFFWEKAAQPGIESSAWIDWDGIVELGQMCDRKLLDVSFVRQLFLALEQ